MSDSKGMKSFAPLRIPKEASPLDDLFPHMNRPRTTARIRPLRNEEFFCTPKKKSACKKLGFDRPSSYNNRPTVRTKPKLSLDASQRKTASFTRTSTAMPPPKSKYVSDLSNISEGIAELDITQTSFNKPERKTNTRSSSVNKFMMKKSSASCTVIKQDMSTQYDISGNITRLVDASTQSDLSEIGISDKLDCGSSHCCQTVQSEQVDCGVLENFENHIQSYVVHKPVVKDAVLQELNIRENDEVQNLKNINDSTSAVNSPNEEAQNLSFLHWEKTYANGDTPTSKDLREMMNEMQCLFTEMHKKFGVMMQKLEKIENTEKNKENINNASYRPNVSKTPKDKNDMRRVLLLNKLNATPHTQLKSAKKWDRSLKMYDSMKHEFLSLQTPVVDKSQSKITFPKENADMSCKVLNQLGLLAKTPEDGE